ncbi:unnamed protein product [Linum tenue]|uniref:Uncharacterized protein n=1 Tax=Linum tenue TaxID=586396 RepID=A0AAV0GW32_9ROSI|nr:unnamed protein product [Linum tenue]
MKPCYALSSPLPMLHSPTTQPHLPHHTPSLALFQSPRPSSINTARIITSISPVPHLLRTHQQRSRICPVSHHEVHQYVLAVAHFVDDPPHPVHCLPAAAAVVEQVPSVENHELGQHDRVPFRVHGVDPLLRRQINVVRPDEESDQVVLVRFPCPERELERLGVHLHIVVDDQHGSSVD